MFLYACKHTSRARERMLMCFMQSTYSEDDIIHHPYGDFKAVRVHTMTYQPSPSAAKIVLSIGHMYNYQGYNNPLYLVDILVYPKSRKYVTHTQAFIYFILTLFVSDISPLVLR